MPRRRLINDHIRRHLRRLRKGRGLTAMEVAQRLELPRTSYVSLESGAYQIKLDHLHRALAVLDADIDDVWPSHLDQEEVVTGRKQLLRMQEFRLNEVLAIGRAKGGLVVSKTEKSVRVHLTSQVSETMTDRILYYLEDNRLFRPGLWFSEREGDVSFLLYLRADQVPKQLDLMIRHYLVIWAAFFESSVTSETPDQS